MLPPPPTAAMTSLAVDGMLCPWEEEGEEEDKEDKKEEEEWENLPPLHGYLLPRLLPLPSQEEQQQQ